MDQDLGSFCVEDGASGLGGGDGVEVLGLGGGDEGFGGGADVVETRSAGKICFEIFTLPFPPFTASYLHLAFLKQVISRLWR